MSDITRRKRTGSAWATVLEDEGGLLLSATVELSSADILGLNSTAVTLVGAQGVGTFLIPIGLFGDIHTGITPYTVGGDIILSSAGGTWGPIINLPLGLAAVAETVVFDNPLGGTRLNLPADDQPIILESDGAVTDGDGTATITTFYLVTGITPS